MQDGNLSRVYKKELDKACFQHDFLMCINILLLALEILKFSSSGLILMNLQFSLFSIFFYLCFP